MVSAQVKGIVRFYRKTANGSRIHIFGGDLASLGPSGSSDGSIASTPEKWQYIPAQMSGGKVLETNDQLVATLELKTAATVDSSDGECVIPITYDDGTQDIIGPFDNTGDWDVKQLGDTAFLANTETDIAIKTCRKRFALGSNVQRAFISVEDNS